LALLPTLARAFATSPPERLTHDLAIRAAQRTYGEQLRRAITRCDGRVRLETRLGICSVEGMTHKPAKPASVLKDRQTATIAFRTGERTKLTLEVDVTSAGLLSIGALVGMTLLSTAILVRAASRTRTLTASPRPVPPRLPAPSA
jgi:hypothetical protein